MGSHWDRQKNTGMIIWKILELSWIYVNSMRVVNEGKSSFSVGVLGYFKYFFLTNFLFILLNLVFSMFTVVDLINYQNTDLLACL